MAERFGGPSFGLMRSTAGAAMALLFLIGAIGNGMDRIAGLSPSVSNAVPALFADASLRSAALEHLAIEDFTAAEILAGAGLRRSPIEPVNAGVLATARLALGKRGPADLAYRVAGQLGWRDPLTQNYWLQTALARGELDVAAERMDALLRTDPAATDGSQVLLQFSASPAGRKALAKRLTARPNWLGSYFLPSGSLSDNEWRARATMLLSLGLPNSLGCDGGARISDGLVRSGEARLGLAVWNDQCSEAVDGLLFDPEFERGGVRAISPFAWEMQANGVDRLTGNPAMNRGGGVELDIPLGFTRVFARQLIVLEPGNYLLSWRAEDAAGKPISRIAASLGCSPDAQQRLAVQKIEGQRLQAVIVSSGKCAGQWLALSLVPGDGVVRLTDLRLTPAR